MWRVCKTLLILRALQKYIIREMLLYFILANLLPFPSSFYPFPLGISLVSFWFILPVFFFCTNEQMFVYFLTALLIWRVACYTLLCFAISHFIVCLRNHFISVHKALPHSTVYTYHGFFNHFPMNGYLGCFQYFVIKNNIVINIFLYIYFNIVGGISSG